MRNLKFKFLRNLCELQVIYKYNHPYNHVMFITELLVVRSLKGWLYFQTFLVIKEIATEIGMYFQCFYLYIILMYGMHMELWDYPNYVCEINVFCAFSI